MLKNLTGLMAQHDWDHLLFYGHVWRKDFFRYLLNVNFSGPWAMASLNRSGEFEVVGQDAILRPIANRPFSFPAGSKVAVAGLELMETRQVEALGITPISATAEVEELRRVKSPEELDCLRRAAALADSGYEYFAEM